MGLLEKAFEYKKKINRKGQSTLIDTIEGPADTRMMDENSDNITEKDDHEDVDFILADDTQDNEDLFELPEDDNYSPLDALNEQKTKIITDEDISTDEPDTQDAELNKTHITTGSDLNPLTSEDEPIIPADIDFRESSTDDELIDNDSNIDDIEIPELEPEGIQENDFQPENKTIMGQDEIDSDNSYPFSETESANKINLSNTSTNLLNTDDQLYHTQFEIKKEISRSETKKTLFEVVIFSVMGQIVTSSVSILIRDPDNNWIIADSNKAKSEHKSTVYDSNSGIMKYLRKDIIDIEKYKNDPECSMQYNDLNAINARLLFPWTYKSGAVGILALGNKITDEDYTDEEKEIIQSICEAASIEFKKLDTIEKLKTDIVKTRSTLSFVQQINLIQKKIYSNNNLKDINNIIKKDFEEIGISGYSVFVNDLGKEKYLSIINGDETILSQEKAVYSISESNPFISFIKAQKSLPRIENYNTSEIVRNAFTESQIKQMSVLWVYPFIIGDILAGFLTIFKVDDKLLSEDDKSEVDEKLNSLSGTFVSAIFNIMKTDPGRNRYTDYVAGIFLRINKELENSKKLNIPITLIVFSIKNFKRYENIFGFEKSGELINHFSKIITNRLSEPDFSARYDRNKILVLLPGKDKKFGATFANTVRNEFMEKFKKNEMQLLVTFLLSESPVDGDKLQNFTDNID